MARISRASSSPANGNPAVCCCAGPSLDSSGVWDWCCASHTGAFNFKSHTYYPGKSQIKATGPSMHPTQQQRIELASSSALRGGWRGGTVPLLLLKRVSSRRTRIRREGPAPPPCSLSPSTTPTPTRVRTRSWRTEELPPGYARRRRVSSAVLFAAQSYRTGWRTEDWAGVNAQTSGGIKTAQARSSLPCS